MYDCRDNKLITLLMILSVMLAFPAAALAGVELGIFLRDEAGCKVVRNGGVTDCSKGNLVAAGDFIQSKNPAKLAIQWIGGHRHKLVEAGTKGTEVALDPDLGKRGLFEAISDQLYFFRQATRVREYLVTRSGPLPATVSPSRGAALLPDRKVVFSSCFQDTPLTIQDAQGKIVRRTEPSTATAAGISPRELGLLPGKSYTWSRGSADLPHPFQVLTEAAAREIESDLATLERSAPAAVDKVMLQLAYLRSARASGGELALSWLARQIAEQLGQAELNEPDRQLRLFLLEDASLELCD